LEKALFMFEKLRKWLKYIQGLNSPKQAKPLFILKGVF
jgi:hypothetical protein